MDAKELSLYVGCILQSLTTSILNGCKIMDEIDRGIDDINYSG